MTLLERYTNRINEQFEKVETTQRDAIIAVGNMIAEKVKDGAAVHVFDSGHIINAELIGRGGGVFFLKRFMYHLDVTDDVRPRDRSGVSKDMTGLAAYALKASNALPGDVIIIGSVSGRMLAMTSVEFLSISDS